MEGCVGFSQWQKGVRKNGNGCEVVRKARQFTYLLQREVYPALVVAVLIFRFCVVFTFILISDVIFG